MYSNCFGTAIQTDEPEVRHIFGSFACTECFKYKPEGTHAILAMKPSAKTAIR